MRVFWIKGSNRFYSNEFGRELHSIQLLKDEDTEIEYLQSYLNVTFDIPEGYQVPCGYYDQSDENGVIADYIKIDKLMVFDKFGNSRGEILIDNLFNLYCSLRFAIENEWA
jgi:hypothetical protein